MRGRSVVDKRKLRPAPRRSAESPEIFRFLEMAPSTHFFYRKMSHRSQIDALYLSRTAFPSICYSCRCETCPEDLIGSCRDDKRRQ